MTILLEDSLFRPNSQLTIIMWDEGMFLNKNTYTYVFCSLPTLVLTDQPGIFQSHSVFLIL